MALTNAQHDLIMRSYEEKQLRNQTILLQHYKEIYEKIPGMCRFRWMRNGYNGL